MMGSAIRDIIVAVSGGGLTLLVVFLVQFIARARQQGPSIEVLSKRITRIDAAVPIMLNVVLELVDSLISVLKAVEEHKLNGEIKDARLKIEDARGMMRDFLAGASISQKEQK